jgi:hypothetical protein
VIDKDAQTRLESVLKSATKVDRPYFEHVKDIRNLCISYLLSYLAGHKPFVERLDKLKANHQPIVGNTLETIESMMSSTIDLPEYEREREQATEYFNELSNLIEEYGLNPDWGMELIHESVTDFHVLAAGIDDTTIEVSGEHTINWDTDSTPSKREAREAVLKQFDEQWASYENSLKAAGFVRSRKRGALKDHVRWTYKKVCLHKTWNELAADEKSFKDGEPNPDPLRKSVYQIIRLLGLRPTRRKGGRPRK